MTNQAHSRQHLIDLLFDEADDPRASLRWTLSQLRRTIGADYIEADRQQIGFDFEQDYWLDIDTLNGNSVEHYRGEFLEGVYLRDAPAFMDWLVFQRERLREQYQIYLTQQLARAEQQGAYETVIEIGHQLVQLDNWREDWYRALMQAYALEGNLKAAQAQYEACRAVLDKEFGAEPEAETTELLAQIQAGTLADPRSLAEISVQYPPFLITEGEHAAQRPVFVAGDRALSQLNAWLTESLDGQRPIAFVTGGAGQGKTALLWAFADQAQAAHPDLLVAYGQGEAFAGIGDPYLPFRDVMRLLTGDVENRLRTGILSQDHARRLWAGLLATCQALLDYGPSLIDMLVPFEGLSQRVRTALGKQADRYGEVQHLADLRDQRQGELQQAFIFQQVTNVLQAIAERQPLLLLLDDLQWADATSLSLLFHLGRRLSHSRVFILGAYRPDEVAQSRAGEPHPLQNMLSELTRQYGQAVLDLADRDEAEARHFVEQVLDQEPNGLGADFRATLFQHTNGHPLFTVELLRAMQERGDLVQDERGAWVETETLDWAHLPGRVEAVIEARIARLEAELRETLTIASVDGEEFSAQVVARVQSLNERHLLRQFSRELVQRHRLVRESNLVRVGSTVLSHYQFAHVLFQRYLYQDLSLGERQLLHAEIGEILETLYGEQAPDIAGQLARHFDEGQQPEKAVPYLRLAGEQAAAYYANDEAIAYFSRALALTPEDDLATQYNLIGARETVYDLQSSREQQGQEIMLLENLAEQLDDDLKRADAALRRANYCHYQGDFTTGLQVAQRAMDLGRQHQSVQIEAQACFEIGRISNYQDEFIKAQLCLKRAVDLTNTANLIKLKAKSLNSLAVSNALRGDFSTAETFFLRALESFKQCGDQRGESQVLGNLSAVMLSKPDYTSAWQYNKQSLELCQNTGNRDTECNALSVMGLCLQRVGLYYLANVYFNQALEMARKVEAPVGLTTILSNFSLLNHRLGEHQIAYDYIQETLQLSNTMKHQPDKAFALLYLGHIALTLSQLEEAADAYKAALTLQQDAGRLAVAMEIRAGLARWP